MSERIDITGNKYNMLTVLGYSETINGNCIWKCRCDCGNITYVRGSNLKNGSVKSCGCLLHREAHNATHRMSRTRLYSIWNDMKQRATGDDIKPYTKECYRGVTVCDDWSNSFESFRDWSFNHGYADDLTIDRIDNSGDYTPENCRWADKRTQMLNRVATHWITYKGETKALVEWCELLGLDYKFVHNRIVKHGWLPERAFTEPAHIEKRNKESQRKVETNV